jgi:hypothetical protein
VDSTHCPTCESGCVALTVSHAHPRSPPVGVSCRRFPARQFQQHTDWLGNEVENRFHSELDSWYLRLLSWPAIYMSGTKGFLHGHKSWNRCDTTDAKRLDTHNSGVLPAYSVVSVVSMRIANPRILAHPTVWSSPERTHQGTESVLFSWSKKPSAIQHLRIKDSLSFLDVRKKFLEKGLRWDWVMGTSSSASDSIGAATLTASSLNRGSTSAAPRPTVSTQPEVLKSYQLPPCQVCRHGRVNPLNFI